MSINVTVSGNPVSIKRGKMVTSDPYTTKKEYEKRRLLRLEQVRQQSKELAEDVRNKVRREKKKQMGEIEKEGKEKLHSWQNRKLLELQNQYQEALEEIGIAHKEAEELGNDSDIFAEERLKNEEIAQDRGKRAETKLQVQKNEESYKKAMPIQHKKLVRDIENTRAALVSCMKKNSKCQVKVKKPKASADINITIPDDSDFEEQTSTESSHLPSIQEEDSEHSEGFCECTEHSGGKVSLPLDNAPAGKTSTKESYRSAGSSPKIDANQQKIRWSGKSTSKSSMDPQKAESKQKSYQEGIDHRRQLIEEFRNRPKEVPQDTRISDRIKRRQQKSSQPDFCDEICDPILEGPEKFPIHDKCTSCPSYFKKIDEVPPVKDPLELSDECICCQCHARNKLKSTAEPTELGEGNRKSKCSCGPDKECKQIKKSSDFSRTQPGEVLIQEKSKFTEVYRPETIPSQRVSTKAADTTTEIPSKPSVKLKDHKQQSTVKTQPSTATSNAFKVRHYDFPNRYEGGMPVSSNVEKITDDSLEVIPNSGSEAEWHEKMKQRDREAQMRGKRALEKERVQRDYEDMIKKLPMLQRKDHIAQIGTDKPEYHMSEERLKQRERERQNRLENAYTQAIPELRPQIITIPSRKHDIRNPDEPFEILDGEDSRTLNLGKWDTETEPKKMFSAEEVQEIIKAFTLQKPEDRKTKLKQLLRSLKLQKEQLINEIQSLPKDDSINALLSDLNSFSDSDENRRKSSRRKKEGRDKENGEKKRRREDSDVSSTSLDNRKHRRKEHHKDKHEKSSRNKVLVLQNTSTQTTPKTTKGKGPSTSTSSTETSSSGLIPSDTKICSKSHVPCDCSKRNEGNSEEVCKIVIKLNEDDLPKVEVVRRGVKDKREIVETVADVQRDKSPKSPRKEKERKSPCNAKRQPKSPEKEKISYKESTERERTKPIAAETDTSTEPLPKNPKKPTSKTLLDDDSKFMSSRKSNESWKEHLSKNSLSTTSTSYLSPPDFSKPNTTASTEVTKESLYNLRKKPQQKNVDRSTTHRSSKTGTREHREPKQSKLYTGIKRLLSISKFSIEELAVSSVSDVQTPSQSIIEIDTNNPMASLHNVIKFINVKASELANELSISPDVTPVPPNSYVTGEGSESKVQQDGSFPEKTTNGSCSSHIQEQLMSQYTDVTDSCSKRIAHLAALIEELRQEKMQMLQNPPITQTSSQRGAFDQPCEQCDPDVCDQGPCNLPRFEQCTPESDKDYSTRYLEFPPSGEKSKGTNSTASMDEEELNKRLLEIDMSLANKLKNFRATRDEKSNSSGKSDTSAQGLSVPPPLVPSVTFVQDGSIPGIASDDSLDQTSENFVKRLKELMKNGNEEEPVDKKSKKKEKKFSKVGQGRLDPKAVPKPSYITETNDASFVPLLAHIPKLIILEPEPEGDTFEYPFESERRHPPPSKGLLTAKKFNGNISLVPHELSTIVEADSQMSTKASPNNSKTCLSFKETNVQEEKKLPTDISRDEVFDHQSPVISEHKSNENLSNTSVSSDQLEYRQPTPVQTETSPVGKYGGGAKKSVQICFDSSDSSRVLTGNEVTCPSLISGTSSSSDLESIEAMLRSIGMEWAIPTLHKTQEALALTSTSSSDDLSSKRKGNKSRSVNSSEVSLKDFLKKKVSINIEKVISSSSVKSDASPASFIQECSEISAIQANSSAENVRQRTSTPVLSSKSTSKTKEEQLFTGASDISSVRNTSCEAPGSKLIGRQSFHSLGSDEELSSKGFGE